MSLSPLTLSSPSFVDKTITEIGKTRVRDKTGSIGTVAYVGSVASAKDPTEQYIGVIWDDVTRGKHDGSVIDIKTGCLVRHFHATHPTSASFVRWNKVDFGVSLTPAVLKQRYVELHSTERIAPNNLLPHTVQTASGKNDKPVEFYGEMKIRSYQQAQDLTSMSLRLMGIASIDTNCNWGDFQQLRDIDLAGNLLSDWTCVLQVVTTFGALETLSLAHNRLNDVPGDFVLPPSHQSLQHLNLNRSNIRSLQSLIRIGTSLPNLTELAVAKNELLDCSSEHKQELAKAFANLTFLDVSLCKLSSEQIMTFASLPRLRHLSLDDNSIDQLHWTSDDFCELQDLQLSGTLIQQWCDFESLNSCRNLSSLRFRRCPLLASLGEGEARSLIIARFPRLEYLNASKVSETERREAARWYLLTVRRAMASGNSQEILEPPNPQYNYWLERYPELNQNLSANTNGVTGGHALAESVLNVTIKSLAASSCTMDPLIRRLPNQMTVGKLKAICFRQFGLDMDLISLHYKLSDDALPVIMDHDEETLAYYGVPDGAEIFMNEIDVETLKRDREREAKELLNRIERQEYELAEWKAKIQKHY